MAGERLLIVEDERIVAEDLQEMLEHLGYEVVGIASSGETAVQKSQELSPALVLMDIRLNGEMDGIQAAETIWAHDGIPVIYLTAYADENTLERAKATLPFGYILKPFEERDVRTTLEVALFKHQMESTLKDLNGWHASALESLPDAIIATNALGAVTFMNPAAESLTGWPLRLAYGKDFKALFQVSSETGTAHLDLAFKIDSSPSSAGLVKERPTCLLKTKEGREVRIEYGISRLKDQNGRVTGNIIALHPAIFQKEPQGAI